MKTLPCPVLTGLLFQEPPLVLAILLLVDVGSVVFVSAPGADVRLLVRVLAVACGEAAVIAPVPQVARFAICLAIEVLPVLILVCCVGWCGVIVGAGAGGEVTVCGVCRVAVLGAHPGSDSDSKSIPLDVLYGVVVGTSEQEVAIINHYEDTLGP